MDSIEAALAHADRVGYPVALKASGGAGGRAIRRAATPADLEAAFAPVRRDAARVFNDRTVFVERWMAGTRHIEVQIQADRHGAVWAIGTRDCSLHRPYQKLVSEAPAAGLTPEVETAILEAALRLVNAAQYRDQASVEFLVDLAGRFYFLEANTRLQVEHVVTELTSGIDLVKLEIDVARGGRLAPVPPASAGHAIEARLNTEDPYNGFAASPGVVTLFRTRPRHVHHAPVPPVPATGAQQVREQTGRVEPIRLRVASPPRVRQRGRIHHLVVDALGHQGAVEPEAIAPRFIASPHWGRRRQAEAGPRLGDLGAQVGQRPGRHGDHPGGVPHPDRERDLPRRAPQIEGHEQGRH